MKRILVIIAMASVVLMMASSVFAWQYTVDSITRASGEYYSTGGEFDIALSGLDTFDSFCLEKSETAGGNKANVSSGAIMGGLAGGNPDPISLGTAYLYSQFSYGTLSGYTYAGSGTWASAGALQEAIWYLENELTSYTSGNTYMGLVLAKYTTEAAAMADANGAFGVAVLNVYYVPPTGGDPVVKQDMLIMVPEPSLLMLLGLGFVGIGILRRKSS